MKTENQEIRQQLGGWEVCEGWTIVIIEQREDVDISGSCADLSMFEDGSVSEIYASHVYEHLGYHEELPLAFSEAKRVLKPDGFLRISVPDMDVLFQLFMHFKNDVNHQFYIQRMMIGGQMDSYDFHKTGFSQNILIALLKRYQFYDYKRVASFQLFNDTSEPKYADVPISLNLECRRALQ
jgi:predicted SAM-dependent methyltransferase